MLNFKQAKEMYLSDFITSMKNGVEAVDNHEKDVEAEYLASYKNFKAMINEKMNFYRMSREKYQTNKIALIKLFLEELFKIRIKKNKDQFDVLQRFVEELDDTLIPDNYKNIFTEATKLLKTRIDYFCSYTSRGAPAINNDYKKALRKQYGNSSIVKEGWNKSNYLAKMIVEFFNDLNFNGFFDRTSMVNGDMIRDEVYNYCSNTTVLVQLLEQKSFSAEDGESDDAINWCFEEYSKYRNTVGKRYIFYKHVVLAQPAAGGDDLQDWFKFTSTSQGVKSATIDTSWDNLRIRAMVNDDAEIIKKERKDLFDSLLSQLK